MALIRPDAMPARPLWPAVLLVVAVCLAYANTLQAPFVYDDTAAIVENPTIRTLWPLTDVLRPQKEGGLTVSGRPVLNLSFALSYALSGPKPWGHHVFNILVHGGNALLLFGIVRRTLLRQGCGGQALERCSRSRETLAFAVAALWALHPLQTQAVTYTVQRAESLMGFFYLLTLYAFARGSGQETGDRGQETTAHRLLPVSRPLTPVSWLGLSTIACALGMATKEVMATAPLVVLLYDRTFVAGTFAAAWRRHGGYYLALTATWLVLAALLASTGGNRGGTAGLGVGVPWWAYGLTQFQAISRYLALSAWPYPLVFEYGTWWVERARDVVPYLFVVVPLVGLTVWALRRRPALGFFGASFFLILAPTSLTPGTIQMIVEHRMYLPLASIVTGAVATAWAWAPRAGLGCLALAMAELLLTAARNHVYRDAISLWSDTVAQRPGNDRAYAALADALAERGRREDALRAAAEAVRLRPDDAKHLHNLGLQLANAGRFAEAVMKYEQSLRLAPDEPRTHNNLGFALNRLGEREGALRQYRAAVRLQPEAPLFHYNLGLALLGSGQTAEAIAEFETVLRLDPDHADAHYNLAAALGASNRLPEAIAHYAEALRIRPSDAEARAMLAAVQFKLGNARLDAGDLPAALAAYTAAVRLEPAHAEAHHNLGIAYARREEYGRALAEFETALRLKPDYPDAERHLRQARDALGR